MNTYISTKVVRAEPMGDHAFSLEQGRDFDPTSVERPGYKVVYPDGYESWSPQGVFQITSRMLTEDEVDLVLMPNSIDDVGADKEGGTDAEKA